MYLKIPILYNLNGLTLYPLDLVYFRYQVHPLKLSEQQLVLLSIDSHNKICQEVVVAFCLLQGVEELPLGAEAGVARTNLDAEVCVP